MRDPDKAVQKLPTVGILGKKIWDLWEAFLVRHPGALRVAEKYGAKQCEFDGGMVRQWRNRLKGAWEVTGRSVAVAESLW